MALEAREISDFQMNEKMENFYGPFQPKYPKSKYPISKILWVPIFVIEIRKIIENEKILKTQQMGVSDS